MARLFILHLTCLFGFISADTISLCSRDKGTIYRKQIHDLAPNAYRTLDYVRSVVECLTYCYADTSCITAVYQRSNACHLLHTQIAPGLEDDSDGDYVVELLPDVNCPSPCQGNSVCVQDCTYAANSTPTCMDLSTDQQRCTAPLNLPAKEFYLSNFDEESDQNNHVFFTVTFIKLKPTTDLKVQFRGTLRGSYQGNNPYGWWEIKFDGQSCPNPGKIHSLHSEQGVVNHQKGSGIHGICKEIAAGPIEISLQIQIDQPTFFRAGYGTHASRLYVEELGDISGSSEHCKSLTRLNVAEDVFTSASSVVDGSAPLFVMQYTKLETDTSLKINLDFVAKTSSTSETVCAAWYIYIDGNHCQPIPYGKIVALDGDVTKVPGEHRSVEVEGHCSNISAGLHEISLQVTTCLLGSWGAGDVETGWGGTVQRLIVEEYRPQSNIKAVISPEGVVYKLPQFNIVTQGAFRVNDGTDNGVVWVLESYTKLYSDSGLRLSLSSDGRNALTSGDCCRHYIVINNAECTNPGTIEGIHHLGAAATNFLQPIMVEGTCDGIPAGDITLSVNAGICRGYSATGDCYFGWNSYVHLMISETYVEREIV